MSTKLLRLLSTDKKLLCTTRFCADQKVYKHTHTHTHTHTCRHIYIRTHMYIYTGRHARERERLSDLLPTSREVHVELDLFKLHLLLLHNAPAYTGLKLLVHAA